MLIQLYSQLSVTDSRLTYPFRHIAFLILTIIGFCSHIEAQDVSWHFVALDLIERTPLPYTHIIAFDTVTNIFVSGVCDTAGASFIELKTGSHYEVTISHLGYNSLSFIFTAHQNLARTDTFLLSEKSSQLGEVVIIDAPPPITIRQDTITYEADSFRTGEEWKLEALLAKLPGIEVQDGEVLFSGKKVEKVLVENKEFFGGNSKLAVEYIPASAVDKVQILENQNDITFLQEFHYNDQLALNVLLKEDRKRLVFGDVTFGGGTDSRYIIQPNAFYYDKSTGVNAISNLNNINWQTLTIADFISLDAGGGVSGISDFDDSRIASYLELVADHKNSYYVQELFNGLNYTFSPKKDLRISSFVLFSNKEVHKESSGSNILLDQDNQDLLEYDRSSSQGNKGNFIGNVQMLLQPGSSTAIAYSFGIKKLSAETNYSEYSETSASQLIVQEDYRTKLSTLQNKLSIIQKFNAKQIGYLAVQFKAADKEVGNLWSIIGDYSNPYIPFREFSEITLSHDAPETDRQLKVKYEHLFKAGRYNQFVFGLESQLDRFTSNTVDGQINSDGTYTSFAQFGFVNNNRLDQTRHNLNIRYRWIVGSSLFELGMSGDYLRQQLSSESSSTRKLLLPNLSAEFTLKGIGKVEASISSRQIAPLIANYLTGPTIYNYDAVRVGNRQLRPHTSHLANINFVRSNVLNNSMLLVNARLNTIENTIQDDIKSYGISSINRPIQPRNMRHSLIVRAVARR